VSRFDISREVYSQVLGRVRIMRFATMRIRQKLCRGHVVNALAVYARVYGHTGVKDFSQAQVHRSVSFMLKGWGTTVIAGSIPPSLREIVGGAESIDENDHRWAEAQVNRFWPKNEEDS
jgi:hypothetical protein